MDWSQLTTVKSCLAPLQVVCAVRAATDILRGQEARRRAEEGRLPDAHPSFSPSSLRESFDLEENAPTLNQSNLSLLKEEMISKKKIVRE